MNDLLEDRLTDLFERVGEAVVVEERLDCVGEAVVLESAPTGSRKRPWMLGAAAAVVLAGAAGVVRVVGNDRSEERTVAEQPVDPGPLYVLPTGLPGWTSRHGSTSSGGAAFEGVVVGIPVGDMFLDPVSVTIAPGPPDRFSVDTWQAISVEGGPAFMSPQDVEPRMVVTQQRGSMWLTSSSDGRDASPIVNAFEALNLNSAGALTPRSPDFAVIASYDVHSQYHNTYSEALGPDDEYVVVETVSGEIPLLAFLSRRTAHLEPMTVNGEAAWHASGRDVDGEWHAIAWEFAPQQSVFLDSHLISYDTVLEVAESLEAVDEATWTAAT